MKQSISVIIPVWNEEKNIQPLYTRLKKTLVELTKDYEILFINDGSTDNSLGKIKIIRRKDKKVKAISFSRNFGHMAAILAGLKVVTGNKVVIIDADLQDPPETIKKMVKKSNEGYKVVYGVKIKRKEGFIRRMMFTTFYKILNKISNYNMPINAGTFSLIDKSVVKIILSMPEKNKYFSGLRAWTGYKQIGVTYERGVRYSGKEASFGRLFKLALDGMISFSYLPLRIASFFGFLCATLSIVSIVIVLVLRIFLGWGIVGWASTMTAILLVSGVQLITLGIIGEYLARIYDEVKNRPEYIIAEKIGFKK